METAKANNEQTSETNAKHESAHKPRNLVLCFDGTGNKFSGDESDTNIVKIYKMLEANSKHQYYYYQPGIGTYAPNQYKNSSGFLEIAYNIWHRISMNFDQMLGASFVDHVLSGYKFIMRYWKLGDHIYIFGFSRGAYTAQFLAEMIAQVGLLSTGNEELVSFVWDMFSKFQRSTGDGREERAHKGLMKDFKDTFCRPDADVYFLGLFDCVNSVGQFSDPWSSRQCEEHTVPLARHVRHAVSLCERRFKFQPALFACRGEKSSNSCKEMWFVGNHADIGGGWEFKESRAIKNLQDRPFRLLSDIPLRWMIDEATKLEDSGTPLALNPDAFRNTLQDSHEIDPTDFNVPHDMLKFGGGAKSWLGTISWWIVEILPFFSSPHEHDNDRKHTFHFRPNLGYGRDIPKSAVYHCSVPKLEEALLSHKGYQPCSKKYPPRQADNHHCSGHLNSNTAVVGRTNMNGSTRGLVTESIASIDTRSSVDSV